MSSFYHAGDIGDTLYGLVAMRELGGGTLWLGQHTALGPALQPRAGITPQTYGWLCTLLLAQPYVHGCRWVHTQPFVRYDLNRFRLFWRGDFVRRLGCGAVQLQKMHLAAFDLPDVDESVPWLVAGKKRVAPVVLARSSRYHNWTFPWARVVEKYKGKSIFVGLPEEYDAFVCEFPAARQIPHHKVALAWELACIINAADLFIGNQSSPYAIAEGLKKTTIQETRNDTAHDEGHDCVFARSNAQFVHDGKVELPDV